MKVIVALQELVQEKEKRIAILKRQLNDHESGVNKLSVMSKASTESSLEKSTILLEKHKKMLEELLQKDQAELEEEERLKLAVERKNYYHYQKVRLKRDKTRSNDEKLEAMLIIDELPTDFGFDDQGLFDIAEKVIELNLTIHEELNKDLNAIKDEFETLIKNIDKENITELGILNYQIPILVLHFSVLLRNIKENREEDGLDEFGGFPKYEDWWIEELWRSHQAYFGLYKWKLIISNLCNTSDQKRAWEVIFANWIFIKKRIGGKKRLGFDLNFAFDTLIRKYAEVEEELSHIILTTMETIVSNLTEKEDFSSVIKEHNLITPYMEFKRKKIGYVDVKSQEAKQ